MQLHVTKTHLKSCRTQIVLRFGGIHSGGVLTAEQMDRFDAVCGDRSGARQISAGLSEKIGCVPDGESSFFALHLVGHGVAQKEEDAMIADLRRAVAAS